MNVVLLHSARTKPYGKLEPVGVWEVSDEGHRCFYPAENEKYEARGRKALLYQPDVPPVEWAHYRADTSPNWRLLPPADSLLDEGVPANLPALLAEAKERFLGAVAASSAPLRAQGKPLLAAPPESKSVSAARIIANSWWLAGELVRRHPELVAYEMHPGGGMYDVLTVAHPRVVTPGIADDGPQIMMNRVGSVHLSGLSGSGKPINWGDVDEHRFSVLQMMEKALGLAPSTPASATGRSLAYRFFASALDLFVTDKQWWDVRCEFLDTADTYDNEDPGHIRGFASAMEDRRSIEPLGIDGEPLSHFFTLLRDDEPVLVVSIEGRLYRKSGSPIDLMHAYARHGRRIRWMTASLLRDWL